MNEPTVIVTLGDPAQPTLVEEAEAAFTMQVKQTDLALEDERGARDYVRRVDSLFTGVIKATSSVRSH